MSSQDRVVTAALGDPRDRLPGIENTVEEEHKGPLFPTLAGGCISLQGNEVILASPNTPSCRRSPKLRDWKPVPSQSLIDTINHLDVKMCGPGPALPGESCALLERKWLKPDIALFVFPVKKRDHFPLIFYLFIFLKGIRRYF